MVGQDKRRNGISFGVVALLENLTEIRDIFPRKSHGKIIGNMTFFPWKEVFSLQSFFFSTYSSAVAANNVLENKCFGPGKPRKIKYFCFGQCAKTRLQLGVDHSLPLQSRSLVEKKERVRRNSIPYLLPKPPALTPLHRKFQHHRCFEPLKPMMSDRIERIACRLRLSASKTGNTKQGPCTFY